MSDFSLDRWALNLAGVAALRADCTRLKVGAVILDTEHRVVSIGWNAAPKYVRGCEDGGCPRGQRSLSEVPHGAAYDDCIAVHAEARAILDAGRHLDGFTIYVTVPPCHECARLITGSGILYTVTPEDLL